MAGLIGAFWLSLGATLTPWYNASGAYYNSSESGRVLAMGQAEYYNTYGMIDARSLCSQTTMLITISLFLHDHDNFDVPLCPRLSPYEHHSGDHVLLHRHGILHVDVFVLDCGGR